MYAYEKQPSDETLAAHTEELENIIAKSDELSLRTPPGIHAELGYIRANQGDNNSARAHYEQEVKTHPESRVFLERIIMSTSETDDES